MNYNIPTEYLNTLIKMTLTHNVLKMRIPEIKFSVNDIIIDIKVTIPNTKKIFPIR